MTEAEEMMEELMERGERDLAFMVGTREVEDQGKVELTLKFASMQDMMRFAAEVMGGQQGIRQRDALDGSISGDRRFVVDRKGAGSVRMFETMEVTS